MPEQKQAPPNELAPEVADAVDAWRTRRPTLAQQFGWTNENQKENYAAVAAAVDEQRWVQPIESDPTLIRIKAEISRLPGPNQDTPDRFATGIAPADESMQAAETAKKTNQFSRPGDVWSISYEDEAVQLPHVIGLEYIAILLRQAGSLVSSTAIEALSRSERPVIQANDNFQNYDSVTNGYVPEEKLDQTARRQYEAEALKLKRDIQEARDRGDSKKVQILTSDLEMIVDQLKRATGRRGRPRRERGDLEKARVRVTHAVNRAIEKIAEHGPKTAAHLRGNIETGTSMMYRDALTHWKL